ncbi:MAG: SRPBCC domain-containing protein [Devosia sp.]
MVEALRRDISLACAPAQAFRIFLDQVDLWWPREHRRFRDGSLRFEAGRLIDRAPDGAELVMADIVEERPPTRLRLAWFPGSPHAPTDVDISFVAADGGTRVTIMHRPLTAEAIAIWPQRVATFHIGWQAVGLALADFVAVQDLAG